MKFQEAITRLNELAKEFQDKNPNMSYQQAVSKALAENPNEAKAYLFKDAPNEKKVYAKIDEAKKDLTAMAYQIMARGGAQDFKSAFELAGKLNPEGWKVYTTGRVTPPPDTRQY